MTKTPHLTGAVSESISEFPSLSDEGVRLQHITSVRGIVKFTGCFVKPEDMPEEYKPSRKCNRIGLKWQSFSELQSDHGLGVTYGVLFDGQFGKLSAKGVNEMLSELEAVLSPSALTRLKSFLDELGDIDDASGQRRIFVTAAWAQEFTEQFSEVWLAAMAQHAYFIEENDFAFGYLSALLDQKANTENHFLRGKVIAKNAGVGGRVKSANFRPTKEAVLAEMRRLVEKGHSRSNAARMVHEKGFGASQAANAKLWDRHSRK